MCYLPVIIIIIAFLLCEFFGGDNCSESFRSNGGMSTLLLCSELLVCARYLRTCALILGSVK